jgi:hypothetical protein
MELRMKNSAEQKETAPNILDAANYQYIRQAW